MAHLLADRVKETTTTTGTGTLALAGAVAQFRAFSDVLANDDTTVYAIVGQSGTEWEVGRGTWTTDNNLARTVVFASSNADAAVNLSAGTKDVFITVSPMGLASPIPAGTATIPPFKFTPGTLLTTPVNGAFEKDVTNFYGTTDDGNRGYIPIRHFVRCESTRTLPNDTNENAIFNSPTNGRITLEVGLYMFKGMVSITSMSATSGNASMDILGAGTATCASWLWHAVGRDNNSNTVAAAAQDSFSVTQQSAASIVSGGTGTTLSVELSGTFEITTGGTLIPSVDQVTAAAGVVAIGSFIMFERMCAVNTVFLGQWD